MRSSASNEKTRKCLDHFFFAAGSFFSDTGCASLLLLRRRAQKNRSAKINKTAITTGTAMAAWSPELHDIELQLSFSETRGASPVVLLAAFSPVAVAESESVAVGEVASSEDCNVEVARVVGLSADELFADVAVLELALADAEVVSVVPVAVDGDVPPFVSENSLCREAAMLLKAELLGPSEPVIPVKPPADPKPENDIRGMSHALRAGYPSP